MPVEAELVRANFSSGEISPDLHARTDRPENQTGLMVAENVIVTLSGTVKRRPGTQKLGALANVAQKGKLVPFRFAPGDAALLAFNNNQMQVYVNDVLAVAGGLPLAVPYAQADLDNLRWAISGNDVFLACASAGRPQLLLRGADSLHWSIAGYQNIGGPVEPQNLDQTQTIVASANTGNITLTASAAFAAGFGGFQQAHVGAVWRLDESDLSLIPQWAGNETVPVPESNSTFSAGAAAIGVMTNPGNAFDNNLASDATQNGVAFSWIGATWTAAQQVSSAVIIGNAVNDVAGAGSFVKASLYASNVAPVSGFDGQLLGVATWNGAVGGTAVQAHTITSSNSLSLFKYQWVMLESNGNHNFAVAELHFNVFNPGGASAVYRRFNGVVYQAITGGSTGGNPPVHTSGIVLSQAAGVAWQYVHRDRGFVRITAVADTQHASATVLEILPLSVVQSATYRWWPSSWDGLNGWPSLVLLTNNSLTWLRKDRFWKTKPGSFFDFDSTDPGDPSQAISGRILSPWGSLVQAEWATAAGMIVVGAHDDEYLIYGSSATAPLTATDVNAWPDQQKGSCAHVPAQVEGGVLFLGRSRGRLFHCRAYPLQVRTTVEEISRGARHILRPGGVRVAFQADPHNVAWIPCADGSLAGLTFIREAGEDGAPGWNVTAFHRHPMVNGFVEDACSLAASDESATNQYFIVRRVINGVTQRFIEKLAPYTPSDVPLADASGAWFVDCGVSYAGAPTNVLAVPHLIGQTVAVHADGAMHPPVVVDGTGHVTLSRMVQNAVVGLPIAWRARPMPIDLNLATGATRGKKTTAKHLSIYLINSAGGYAWVNPDETEAMFQEPLDETGALTYGAPVPLKTGLHRVEGILAALADECTIELGGADTMPFEFASLYPVIDVAEGQ